MGPIVSCSFRNKLSRLQYCLGACACPLAYMYIPILEQLTILKKTLAYLMTLSISLNFALIESVVYNKHKGNISSFSTYQELN